MSITKVRTRGVLSGQDIHEDARKAREVAQLANEHRHTVSAREVAREHVRRAMRRVAHGKGTTGFARVVREMDRQGLDILEVCDYDLTDPAQVDAAEWVLTWLDA